jgi:hypothetical protein
VRTEEDAVDERLEPGPERVEYQRTTSVNSTGNAADPVNAFSCRTELKRTTAPMYAAPTAPVSSR